MKYHKLLKDVQGFDCKVLPSFRPDKALNAHLDGFADYIKSLSATADVEINSYKDVITALLKRVDYFDSVGCKVSDQAFDYPPYSVASDDEIDEIFCRAMKGEKITLAECDKYRTPICWHSVRNITSLAGLWKFISVL